MSDHICDVCGNAASEDFLYLTNPAEGEQKYHHLCPGCAVRLWPCNVQFIWHYGVPQQYRAHLETFTMLERLRRWSVNHVFVPVHFFHRRESEQTKWLMDWDTRAKYATPTAPYGYRAWCSGNEIIALVDETETPESLEWVFYHELAHAVCNRARMYDDAMHEENKTEGRTTYEWRDDAAHEADSEERLVNRIATAHCGGKERARAWWRPRVTARDRGYTVLPDAHAPTRTPEFYMFCAAKEEGWASPLPICGLDTTTIYPLVQVHAGAAPFTEEERKQPEFWGKLNNLLNPNQVYDHITPIVGPITGSM